MGLAHISNIACQTAGIAGVIFLREVRLLSQVEGSFLGSSFLFGVPCMDFLMSFLFALFFAETFAVERYNSHYQVLKKIPTFSLCF